MLLSTPNQKRLSQYQKALFSGIREKMDDDAKPYFDFLISATSISRFQIQGLKEVINSSPAILAKAARPIGLALDILQSLRYDLYPDFSNNNFESSLELCLIPTRHPTVLPIGDIGFERKVQALNMFRTATNEPDRINSLKIFGGLLVDKLKGRYYPVLDWMEESKKLFTDTRKICLARDFYNLNNENDPFRVRNWVFDLDGQSYFANPNEIEAILKLSTELKVSLDIRFNQSSIGPLYTAAFQSDYTKLSEEDLLKQFNTGDFLTEEITSEISRNHSEVADLFRVLKRITQEWQNDNRILIADWANLKDTLAVMCIFRKLGLDHLINIVPLPEDSESMDTYPAALEQMCRWAKMQQSMGIDPKLRFGPVFTAMVPTSDQGKRNGDTYMHARCNKHVHDCVRICEKYGMTFVPFFGVGSSLLRYGLDPFYLGQVLPDNISRAEYTLQGSHISLFTDLPIALASFSRFHKGFEESRSDASRVKVESIETFMEVGEHTGSLYREFRSDPTNNWLQFYSNMTSGIDNCGLGTRSPRRPGWESKKLASSGTRAIPAVLEMESTRNLFRTLLGIEDGVNKIGLNAYHDAYSNYPAMPVHLATVRAIMKSFGSSKSAYRFSRLRLAAADLIKAGASTEVANQFLDDMKGVVDSEASFIENNLVPLVGEDNIPEFPGVLSPTVLSNIDLVRYLAESCGASPSGELSTQLLRTSISARGTSP